MSTDPALTPTTPEWFRRSPGPALPRGPGRLPQPKEAPPLCQPAVHLALLRPCPPPPLRGALSCPRRRQRVPLVPRTPWAADADLQLAAPMLPVLQSPHNTSFYTKSTQPGDSLRESSYSSKIWFPLGGAWREQERGLDGEVLRTNIDDGREFVNGCIPNWSSDCAIRSPAAVEHKLSWAYYRMRGMRAALGHTDQVPSSKQSRQQFNFWTDLRPPFRIKGMKRDADDGHPDGPLFRISYCCPLDYVTERKWGRRTAEGTFENLVHGVAEVRIPKDFPQVSTRIIVLSWGRVEIKFGTKPKVDKKAGAVDPKKWSPIAAEFHLRSNCSRLASLRESLHEANLKMAGQSNQQAVRPWQKALMKPSATLADFMKAEQLEQKEVESVKRDLRLRTACAGFIENAG
ncbi:unnamed protein product [Durusdinium trenchii]|uniref:Uncharacterized protein n=1 Tax=Durusdinium trenchii TaxID=1381693 RepID=A0ABP0QGT3_9DINO